MVDIPKVTETEAQGPYKPKWTNRRRLTFWGLAYFAVLFPPVTFWAPAETAVPAQYIIGSLSALLISYYLIGPSVETVRLALAWMKK